MEFNSHAEKEFWEKVYIAAISGGAVSRYDAEDFADEATSARRLRMVKLVKPGIKAA